MRRTFLQNSSPVIVADMTDLPASTHDRFNSYTSVAEGHVASRAGHCNGGESRAQSQRKQGILCNPLARFAGPACAALLLSGCGLSGTDNDPQDSGSEQAQAAPQHPDLARFEEEDIADPVQRPEMQVQVVLDQLGFGPGIIDGTMGLSTENALKGFQEASGLQITGKLDESTKAALARWNNVPATKVVRIPESWGQIQFAQIPDDMEEQGKLEHLSYESLAEKLAERFHTTPEALAALNPGGRPAGDGSPPQAGASTPANAAASGVPAYPPRTRVTPTSQPSGQAQPPQPVFRPGQLVRVPNVGLGDLRPATGADEEWQRTLVSLGVSGEQPKVARVVVDKSEGTLRAYDGSDKLVALFTVTTGSEHDPLPLGEWKILGVSRNTPFNYNPDLFWDADPDHQKTLLPPGPNGPVGVVWIDLSKEHYGIHGTPEPQTIGRTQSHGCVRLTNWDAARLAGMVSTQTQVIFQA